MQPNTITLPVDETNTNVVVNHVLSRFEEFQNRSTYIESNHSVAARDQLQFYRTFPKASGNFRGTSKCSVKFTKDLQVTGVDGVSSLTSPIIVEVSFSIPVGASTAEILLARQKAIALLDLDSVMTPFNEQLMV